MANRFVADLDLFAVHDTQTDLYAGFLFAETAQEITDMLNNGVIDIDSEVVEGWEPRYEPLSQDELDNKRALALTFAELLGVEIPDYAAKWLEENVPV